MNYSLYTIKLGYTQANIAHSLCMVYTLNLVIVRGGGGEGHFHSKINTLHSSG